MNKEKSLEILNNCLSKISSMSLDEFNRIEKERGLDKLNLSFPSIDSDFEIIFSSIKLEKGTFVSYYDYSISQMNQTNVLVNESEIFDKSETFILAA
jgi:hypothetical protein